MAIAIPAVDNWYEERDTGRQFRIVALDDTGDTIEIQYLEGDLSELDRASWDQAAIIEIEAPEDWSAPFDDVETDDLGYSDPDLHLPDTDDLTLDDVLEDEDKEPY
ncbi:DUF6763 family protein [Methylococcus capsulatus]|uniref:DUF6763 family protein n=1 Tax=Methylococcus capsulatus TaxID=414 RepID=UPI001C53275F|nr:DUF6763 family protein [Methylococcus capsulatus]QXP88619.1 hypothetical protein KW112_05760 [Methylococcus capsulatus]QXP94348.1 hypothetical protein KW113_03875 [Methylococcus capsulatus]UQN10894.1 hypothetical protein M3M30_07490 [Methylococcus capsulatus]